MAGGIGKTLFDFIITTVPIPLIMSLNLPKRSRYGVVVLLTTGYVITAAGCIRTYYTWKIFYTNSDWTWWQSRAFLAGSIENDLAIICACVPTIKPLFPYLFGGIKDKIKSWPGKSSHYSTEASHDRSLASDVKSKSGTEKTGTESHHDGPMYDDIDDIDIQDDVEMTHESPKDGHAGPRSHSFDLGEGVEHKS